ncbi:hypothetical protein ACHAW6_015851, partial [Cyclotella cf. meneghiniana]
FAASTADNPFDHISDFDGGFARNIEYRVGTFYDDMEEEDCIDLDYILENELPMLKIDDNFQSKKKEDILKIIDSLNIDLGKKGFGGSRLKRRPESPDIGDSQQSAESQEEIQETDDEVDDSDSVLIISAIDGTLAGISRSSGQIIWKQSRHNHDASHTNDSTPSSAVSVDSWNTFLSPLVSTTTKSTSKSPGRHHSQWHAVPSIDGTVYLTAAVEDGTALQELSITTHIRDLVDRAPFVDAHGRFFVGSRRAMVAAIDERTGEILRVIPKWKSKRKESSDSEDEIDGENKENGEDDDEELPPSLEGRNVVWIGRLEHTVTVHDLQKGTVDIEFSVAQILSVDEMIQGNQHYSLSPFVVHGDAEKSDMENEESVNIGEKGMERLFTKYIAEALRHPHFGDRLLSLPAPSDFDEVDVEDIFEETKHNIDTKGSPFFVSTPGGNVAFRDSVASTFGWVSFNLLDSPVIYAIEASSGQKIKVNIIPDALSPSDSEQTSQASSSDALPELLQRQIAYLSQQSMLFPDREMEDECSDKNLGDCRALAVNSLEDGQLYALPLGTQSSRQQSPLALALPHSKASSLAHAQDIHRASELSTNHAIGFHGVGELSGMDADSGDKQRIHVDSGSKQACSPSSPLYPGCLIGVSLMMGNIILDRDEMASVFEASDLDFDLYLDMLEGNNNRKKSSFFQKLIKIMSSWIAPVVALIFVVSFEMGRRERLKAERKGNADSSNSVFDESSAVNRNSGNNPGVIQLTDEILGYGGHGTIVYKGVLDKRQVAVKRLLSMYHTSADREISLLIESDGHPNVVRYFLKEIRGDFVYLALELCDMSLNDLIVSLSKLKNARKENLHLSDTDDFESATKSLLFQIASGVRHIHSLRIVHRDLKPQNILLAQRTRSKSTEEDRGEESDSDMDVDETTQTTCSDTNAILEMFMNDEYVPKISDMGLGKQLAGQSSFGLSTLGTGSIGPGPGCNPSIVGAGAGSVGWQAPEVMAMRFSNESSSYDGNESMSEASPYEATISARTSRSVDIFSLGCIFYCTILPGSHPFGEWYEREANIMKNKPNKDDLEFVSPDASDLILSMIHRNAKSRPTADEVCEHPFFWSLAKRLKFLCELSDRIELCDTDKAGNDLNIFAIEKGAFDVFGTSWEKKVDPELIIASLNRRTYDPASVRDCLRMIRNKHHHYDELPAHLKSRIGSNTDGFSRYISRRFPRLVIHCYHFCIANLNAGDSLALDYKLPISSVKSTSNQTSSIIELTDPLTSLEPISDVFEKDNALDGDDEKHDSLITSSALPLKDEAEIQCRDTASDIAQYPPSIESVKTQVNGSTQLSSSTESVTGIVVWSGSNAAKQFNCRGWIRSEDEWIQRLDAKLRKRDANVARCADDPKFRTRLCNEWDISGGTFCPMRKKNKCIFAHGPVELRVKEGKRKRWGTLVSKHGDCANPRASGGEDTYTAAKSIEDMRKEKGEWNASKTPKKQQKPSNKSKEQKREQKR